MDVEESQVNLVRTTEISLCGSFVDASDARRRFGLSCVTENLLFYVLRKCIVISPVPDYCNLISFCWYLLTLYIKQISKDGDSFTVPLAVAKMSELVKSMMDGTCVCV